MKETKIGLYGRVKNTVKDFLSVIAHGIYRRNHGFPVQCLSRVIMHCMQSAIFIHNFCPSVRPLRCGIKRRHISSNFVCCLVGESLVLLAPVV